MRLGIARIPQQTLQTLIFEEGRFSKLCAFVRRIVVESAYFYLRSKCPLAGTEATIPKRLPVIGDIAVRCTEAPARQGVVFA